MQTKTVVMMNTLENFYENINFEFSITFQKSHKLFVALL